MINKVGLCNDNLNLSEFFKKYQFTKTIFIDDSISKITSVMVWPNIESTDLSNFGVIIHITLKIKIIYSKSPSESLYISENTFNDFVEIAMPSQIDATSLSFLLKSNQIKIKFECYEIFSKIISSNMIFLKVYSLILVDYKKPLSLLLTIENENLTKNLYLSDTDFQNIEQITFFLDSSLKLAKLKKSSNLIYFIQSSFFNDNIYVYNIKLRQTTLLCDYFVEITNFKVYNNILFILGKTEEFSGLFSFNLTTNFLDLVDDVETLSDIDIFLFNNSLNKLILLKNNTLILKSLETLTTELTTTLESSNYVLSLDSKFLAYLNEKKQLLLQNIDSLNVLQIGTFSKYSKIKFLSILSDNKILFILENLDSNSSIFISSLNTKFHKPLYTSKQILNPILDKSRNFLYFIAKSINSYQVLKLNLNISNCSAIQSLYKLNALSIQLDSSF